MDALQQIPRDKPAKFDPANTKALVSQTDAVIGHATRIQDWPMLDRAVEVKVDELCAFVEWWETHVTPRLHGQGKSKKYAGRSDHILSLAEAETQTQIKHEQVSRWRRKRKDPEKWKEDIKAAAKRRSIEDALQTTATKWTGDPESYTPAQYIEAARAVMGGIDLDPASDPLAQKIVRATEWFSATDDGLQQPWQGRVFLNPPYAHPLIAYFIDKLLDEWNVGNVEQAILLTNNNTDTKWFHAAAELAAAVCFTKGRINFYKPDGTVSQPTNGQTFFYFGPYRDLFVTQFLEFGLLMETLSSDHSLSEAV